MTLITNLAVVLVVVLWLALVFWTFADARRRVADRFMVAVATVTALIFPFIGSLVYFIVRPPEFLEDVRERNLEIAAAEARLGMVEGHTCPHCDAPTSPDFVRCPSCLRRLREPCPSCSRPLDAEWRICPYCEADPKAAVAGRTPARPTQRKRASTAETKRKPAARKQPAAKPAAAEPSAANDTAQPPAAELERPASKSAASKASQRRSASARRSAGDAATSRTEETSRADASIVDKDSEDQ